MTAIIDLPIPLTPTYFGPDGAPPGVELQLDAYQTLDDGYWWLASRPLIQPHVIVVHTNAASREGTVDAAINWGKSSRNRTKPHYCVNWPWPTKTLATNKRGIANSTTSTVEAEYGVLDSSFWSIAIETADTGTLDDPDISDFLTESTFGTIGTPHAEIVARIIAYESIVWDFPIKMPAEFYDPGVVSHTDPFGYGFFTTVLGKTCPGDKKKATVRNQIIPRAAKIKAAWLGQEEPSMTPYIRLVDKDGNEYADQFKTIAMSADSKRRNGEDGAEVLLCRTSLTRAELEAKVGYELTPMP